LGGVETIAKERAKDEQREHESDRLSTKNLRQIQGSIAERACSVDIRLAAFDLNLKDCRFVDPVGRVVVCGK